MKLSRLAGLVFLFTLAVSVVAAAGASAAAPEFHPSTEVLFRGDSGTGVLETEGADNLECTSDSVHGYITGSMLVGSLIVIFHGCKSKEKEGCSIKSVGGPNESLIITNTLHGELGSVKTSEAESGVGLLLTPATGSAFFDLEGTCLLASPAPLDGSVAGEVTPIGASSRDGKVIFLSATAGKQKIKEINVLGTVAKPQLKALGLLNASEQTGELILWISAIEVT